MAGNTTRALVGTSPISEEDLARLHGLRFGGISRHRFEFMASNESAATGEVDREYAGESAVELRGSGEGPPCGSGTDLNG